MTRTRSLLIIVLLFASASAEAQRRRSPEPKQPVRMKRTDTSIRSATLEVYQQYEPELKPLTKVELAPTLPPPPAQRSAQQYDVPQQTLYYSYRALPLRPLALGTADTAAAAPLNYVALAGGNLSTILGEIGIGSLRGRDWQTAIQARYITQEGNPEDQVFRSFRLRGDGTLRKYGHLLEGGLEVQRNVFGAYGYDHEVNKYDFSQVRRIYSGAAITLGAQNETPTWMGITYHPVLTYSYYTGTVLNNEQTLSLSLPVRKQIDSNFAAEIGINAWITSSKVYSDPWHNNIYQLTPRVSYSRDRISGHLGLYPTKASVYYLLPDIEGRYRIGDNIAIASAGWKASFVQNTIRQLTTANPFYLPSSTYAPTLNDDVFAGLSLALGKHLSVTGRAGWNQWRNLPLFITKPSGDGKDFNTLYDPKVQAIVWNAGLRYAIGEDFSLGAEGTWYNYYQHSYARVWGAPGIRLKGNASLMPVRGLLVTAYVEVMDQIWGQDSWGGEIKLKGVFDIGAAAEYTVIERLNLFIRTENLLGRHNERWLGYPSFGFNIYGGARFRF